MGGVVELAERLQLGDLLRFVEGLEIVPYVFLWVEPANKICEASARCLNRVPINLLGMPAGEKHESRGLAPMHSLMVHGQFRRRSGCVCPSRSRR